MIRRTVRRSVHHRSHLRRVALGVASAAGAFLLTSAGCGTDAKGIDACRDIELARCEAAEHCGTIDDVAACRRFYRDHCLHGLAKGIEPPPRDRVDECVRTIERAGACARGEREAELESCPTVTRDANGARLACDIVLCPEYSEECSFLGSTRGCTAVTTGPGGSGEGGQGGAR